MIKNPAPSFPSPSDPFLKRQVQWLLLLRVIFLTILLALNILFQTTERAIIVPPFEYITNFIIAVYLFTIGSALLLTRIKQFSTFAYFQILVDAGLVTILIYFSGCSQSIFTVIYFFPVIAGSFILPRFGGIAMAIACTLGYGSVLLLEYYEYYPLFFHSFWYRPISNILVVFNYASIHSVSFFLASLLSSQLARRLYKAEKALTRTSLEYDHLSLLYKQIFDDVETGIIILGSQGRINSFNPASERISGFKSSEIIGQHIDDTFPELPLKDRKNLRTMIELTRKDGITIPITCSMSNLHLPEIYGACQVITIQDLSEIKMMEDQVHQAEKMAAIGEMAASIAHEFRNPLTAISGSAQVLSLEIAANSVNKRLMEIIINECMRLENKISQFLLFSKPSPLETDWVLLHALVTDVLLFLKQGSTWQGTCRTQVDIPEEMDCWADPQQLTQVLINLFHNSCVVMSKEGGEIMISARESRDEDGRDMTIITVKDTGPGIPEENIDKIFNPFFTTREDGTGLGLAIVKQIIKNHNGTIEVKSVVGKGTTFVIALPLA